MPRVSSPSPAIVSAQTAEDRATARRRLLQVGCALAVHRAEQGEYPVSLDALAPGLLDPVPLDPFGDQPFQYRRTDEGGYRLYSVGENLADAGIFAQIEREVRAEAEDAVAFAINAPYNAPEEVTKHVYV